MLTRGQCCILMMRAAIVNDCPEHVHLCLRHANVPIRQKLLMTKLSWVQWEIEHTTRFVPREGVRAASAIRSRRLFQERKIIPVNNGKQFLVVLLSTCMALACARSFRRRSGKHIRIQDWADIRPPAAPPWMTKLGGRRVCLGPASQHLGVYAQSTMPRTRCQLTCSREALTRLRAFRSRNDRGRGNNVPGLKKKSVAHVCRQTFRETLWART